MGRNAFWTRAVVMGEGCNAAREHPISMLIEARERPIPYSSRVEPKTPSDRRDRTSDSRPLVWSRLFWLEFGGGVPRTAGLGLGFGGGRSVLRTAGLGRASAVQGTGVCLTRGLLPTRARRGIEGRSCSSKLIVPDCARACPCRAARAGPPTGTTMDVDASRQGMVSAAVARTVGREGPH